tara:strand:- start:20005 stop:20820 length:816 start_codon:yes stop_codon:yes gene_type:complete
MHNFKEIFELKTKKTFILGGLGLIGKSLVQGLSEAGSEVLILDQDINRKEKFLSEGSFPSKVSFEFFDCSDLENIEENMEKLISANFCPDIFINCSYPRTKDFSLNSYKEIELSSLRKNVDIHLNSYAWTAISIANRMVESSIKGSIIQFSSIYGLVGQDLSIYENTEMKENASYSIIKGGINNLTRSMGSYYGKKGLRINSICPGAIEGHVVGKAGKQNKEFVENFSKKVPIGRLAKAHEIVGPVLFLASEASSYVTGSILVVDGGWTAI